MGTKSNKNMDEPDIDDERNNTVLVLTICDLEIKSN
jgi:hypothetical protein